MANAKAKLYHTFSKYLPSLPVANGNIIFVQDTHEVCLDMHDKRVTYSTIYVFEVEADREGFLNPAAGFYYVKQSNILWRYDDNKGWRQITAEGLTPIVMTDTEEELPDEGNIDQLYVTDNGIYKWKEVQQNYHLVATKNEWKTTN